MNAEQLTDAVRKHAKTVLLPSVAQAIVEELGMQEAQPLFILHTGAFFGNEQDEWEVEAISQERVADYCRERSSQHDPLYTTPPDAAKRIADLEMELAEARKDAERWKFIRRKLCVTGNGDGTCSMFAINLPAMNPGWPEHGMLAEFCDSAIDAAIS